MSWESRHGPWIEKSKVLHLQHHHPIPESPERCCEHRLCEISKKCWVKGSFHWSLGCILYIDGIWWHPGRFYNIELDSASPTCHLWASCTVLLAHFKPARQQRRSQNHWVQGCHALANINGMNAFFPCENSEATAKPPSESRGWKGRPRCDVEMVGDVEICGNGWSWFFVHLIHLPCFYLSF